MPEATRSQGGQDASGIESAVRLLRLRLLIDECLSPTLRSVGGTRALCVPCRDRGLLNATDQRLRDWCIDNDFALITHNAQDFRKLVGQVALHPGLIVLAENTAHASSAQLEAAIQHLLEQAPDDPMTYLVNKVVTVDRDCGVTVEEIPPAA